ncbi:hypothetical protein EON67_12375 [archaeon]|nr:MAG: hypothetical protein EON67_12375 [archaeon]
MRHAHAPHSDATSAEQSARQHNPDLDFKGDEEEDEVSDEEEGTAPLMGGTAEAEAEAEAAAAEEEETEETEGDEPAGQSLAELRRSRAALLEVEKDDTRVVLGGVAGFFLATAVGAMLVRHSPPTHTVNAFAHMRSRVPCNVLRVAHAVCSSCACVCSLSRVSNTTTSWQAACFLSSSLSSS